MRGKLSFFKMQSAILILGIIMCCCSIETKASSQTYFVDGESYELADESGYVIQGQTSKNSLCYGAKSIGSFSVSGDIQGKSTYGKYAAYGTTDEFELSYSYNGDYQTKDKEAWNLTSSDEKSVNGIELDKKVELGSIIVQKSTNGSYWETVYVEKDVFDKHKTGINSFYKVSLEDIKKGTYYRVYVAYRMTRKTGTEKKFLISTDVFSYKTFVEKYELYTSYEANALSIRDIDTGDQLSNNAKVSTGFIIDKNDTTNVVTITKDNGVTNYVADLASFTEQGTYKIEMTSKLGKKYTQTITIVEGSKFTELSPIIYDGGKKDSYEEEGLIEGKTFYGQNSGTILKLGTQSGSLVSISEKNGVPAYGVTGEEANLYLNLSRLSGLSANYWEVYYDDYGKKEKETIAGVQTGEVGTGALIVQKSTNGTDWENVDLSKYGKGLYTTDYFNNYAEKGDVLIYSPKGEEILKGVYLRVYYAYQLKEADKKNYNRTLELYELYLCSNELGAVTFHNLSVTDDVIREQVGADKKDDIEIYKKAETLLSGSGTTTGFRIDTSLNPTVTYTVKRDGTNIAVPGNKEFTANGKYEITLKSAVGDTEVVYIYVDKDDSVVELERYFGDGFISSSSKRIYDEGMYPIFEGGQTEYSLSAVGVEFLPISGTITNTTTGETINISSSKASRSGKISTPGEYVATFTTQQTSQGVVLPGDYRVFTFKFRVIAAGTAPGPKVNESSLSEYASSSMVDSYPMFYAVTYSSANKGNITIAFSTKEAAKEFAYNYEKGTVEVQADGTYRYTGSILGVQKDEYVSAWDLTDAMNQFAEQAVQYLYFDLSDQFTYLTLEDDVIKATKNLRTLELDRSITIFADGEKVNLCNKADSLPIISKKPYAYLTPGESEKVKSGYHDFKFVKDKYGCDSNQVTITDCNGKVYEIAYNQGVGAQLDAAKCATGKVNITETTIYGDRNSYEAIYIASGDNTGALTISYYENNEEKQATYKQSDAGKVITVEAFRLNSLVDSNDPYSMVKVSDSTKTYAYAADQDMNYVWSNPGTYTISVINRLGNEYSFSINIVESNYVTIAFAGIETDGLDAILTTTGAKDIELPALSRYGYELLGYEDQDGNVYAEKISEIAFKGETVLKAIWKAKTYNLTYTDATGNTLKSLEVEFGGKYTLESFDSADGDVVDSWMYKGELLETDSIAIDEEGDIVLTAVGSDGVIIDTADAEKSVVWPMTVVIILLIAAVVGIIGKKNNYWGIKKFSRTLDTAEKEGAEDETED